MKRKKQILKEIKNLVMEYKALNEKTDIPAFKKSIGLTIKSAKIHGNARKPLSTYSDEEILTILFDNNKTLQLQAAPESTVGDETYIYPDKDVKKMKGKTIQDIKNLDYDTEVQITMTDGSSFTFKCDSESAEGAIFNYYFK